MEKSKNPTSFVVVKWKLSHMGNFKTVLAVLVFPWKDFALTSQQSYKKQTNKKKTKKPTLGQDSWNFAVWLLFQKYIFEQNFLLKFVEGFYPELYYHKNIESIILISFALGKRVIDASHSEIWYETKKILSWKHFECCDGRKCFKYI